MLKMSITRWKIIKSIENDKINWIFDLFQLFSTNFEYFQSIFDYINGISNKSIEMGIVLIDFIVRNKDLASNSYWKVD